MSDLIKFSEMTKFFPKQEEALLATKRFKYVLFGGSVGSGKSYWIRWSCLYWLMYYYNKYDLKGVRAGLFCEDYPILNDRHLTKIKYEFPDWLGTFNESKKEFTLADDYGGGIIAFRNLDDPSKYLSVEFAVIAIDEINRNPKSTFDMLRSRHRWPGIKDTKFIAGCNPLGEAWVKNMWVKRLFPPNEAEQYEFVYVPALPTDNPHLPPEYYKSLESLPDTQRKAYLEGNWDAFDEEMDDKGYVRLVNDRELQSSMVNNGDHSGFRILGVDPAAGGDRKSEDPQFGNLKAEWHWRQRKWLLSGGRLLQDTAWNEFEVVKYKNKDGKIVIQPKEELFKDGISSPNCVDAAVLTMAITDSAVQGQRIIKANRGRPFYDAMDSVWEGKSIDKFIG
jgi:hypothetical protein